jgi:hypothetical protein
MAVIEFVGRDLGARGTDSGSVQIEEVRRKPVSFGLEFRAAFGLPFFILLGAARYLGCVARGP